MDELVNQIVQRTGISEEQARSAIQTVLGFLKERLPEPIAGHLDSVVGTGGGEGGGEGGGLGDLGSALGGLFGNK